MARLQSFPLTRPLRLDHQHRDFELLSKIEDAIYRYAGGKGKFEQDIPRLLRQAIDEVIDSPRSRRFLCSELEPTEKTYLGTKVEIMLRNHLNLEPGIVLDVLIDGVEVDIKNTTGKSWMIPGEAIGHPCILIRTDDKKAKCWFGLVVMHGEILRAKTNQDKKTSISAANFVHIQWMLYDHDYPMNFWEAIPRSVRDELLAPVGGTERVVNLFKRFPKTRISRQVILALAPQHDSMRRLRKNGGARDKLGRGGFALLSGMYDSSLIAKLNLPECGPEDFLSFHPETEKELELVREAGHL